MEFFSQDGRVGPLHPAGHGLSDERKRLMTIETAQLDDFSVQFETVVGKRCLAKSNPPSIPVCNLRPAAQADFDGIEMRAL